MRQTHDDRYLQWREALSLALLSMQDDIETVLIDPVSETGSARSARFERQLRLDQARLAALRAHFHSRTVLNLGTGLWEKPRPEGERDG